MIYYLVNRLRRNRLVTVCQVLIFSFFLSAPIPSLAMPAGYVSLPNPRSNPEREMADAFDLDEDVNDNHYEATPLSHNSNQPSATGHVFRRETASIPGAYDFEREYDFPPPGSPPRPSSRALPNDFGNSNGLLPIAPVQIPKPRVSFFRRTVGAILPTHYTRVPTTEVHSTRLTGGGIENDGVFANVTAKPQPSRVIHTEDGGIYMVPENAEDQTPPVSCPDPLCLKKLNTQTYLLVLYRSTSRRCSSLLGDNNSCSCRLGTRRRHDHR